MSAEQPPTNNSNEKNENSENVELTTEQLKDAEHKLITETERFQAAKAEAEALDAEKLATIRQKLNLEVLASTETSSDIETATGKYKKSLEDNAENIENSFISWEDVKAPMDWNEGSTLRKSSPEFKTLLRNEATSMRKAEKGLKNHALESREGMAGVDLEALTDHAEGNEKMREGMEDHIEALGEKAAGEYKEFKKAKEAEKKKAEALKSAVKSGVLAVSSISIAGGLGYVAASYFASTPVFSAAAGLAGFTGFGAVLGAGIALWFFKNMFDSFQEAGGISGLVSSITSGFGGGGAGHAAPKAKKAAGGGHGDSHGGGGGAHH